MTTDDELPDDDLPDDDLLAQLRRIANEVDALPDLVEESARAAFSTRRLDDELAELLNDSDVTASAVRGVQPGPRLLSFESGPVSLELQIEHVGNGLVLRGLAVGAVGDVKVETTTTTARTTTIDEAGWFRLEDLPVEPLRVRVRSADGTSVTTGWIRG